jgi:hypothetical protein
MKPVGLHHPAPHAVGEAMSGGDGHDAGRGGQDTRRGYVLRFWIVVPHIVAGVD